MPFDAPDRFGIWSSVEARGVVVVIEVMASMSTNFGAGVRGGAVRVLLEGEGVMSQMKPIASHDRVKVAQLLETAAQEEALIEELEKATRALWRARHAKDVLGEMSVDGLRPDDGCRSAPQ